jgi:hypothetical protein
LREETGWEPAPYQWATAGYMGAISETDCQTLTGCDWGKKEDIKRYYKDEVYKDTCFRQFEYVIEKCISEKKIAEN